MTNIGKDMDAKEIIIMRCSFYHTLYGSATSLKVYCVFKGSLSDAKKFCKAKTGKSRNCEYYPIKAKVITDENYNSYYEEIKSEKLK